MQLVLRQTRRRRLLLPVPFPLASLAAFFAELLPTPPLTRDQVKLLKRDNVVSGEHPTLVDLGIRPTADELILPTYLDLYRRGGRITPPEIGRTAWRVRVCQYVELVVVARS